MSNASSEDDVAVAADAPLEEPLLPRPAPSDAAPEDAEGERRSLSRGCTIEAAEAAAVCLLDDPVLFKGAGAAAAAGGEKKSSKLNPSAAAGAAAVESVSPNPIVENASEASNSLGAVVGAVAGASDRLLLLPLPPLRPNSVSRNAPAEAALDAWADAASAGAADGLGRAAAVGVTAAGPL